MQRADPHQDCQNLRFVHLSGHVIFRVIGALVMGNNFLLLSAGEEAPSPSI